MIDGALPPLLGVDDSTSPTAPPAGDPAAAEVFAALVAQLLGGAVAVAAAPTAPTAPADDIEPADDTPAAEAPAAVAVVAAAMPLPVVPTVEAPGPAVSAADLPAPAGTSAARTLPAEPAPPEPEPEPASVPAPDVETPAPAPRERAERVEHAPPGGWTVASSEDGPAQPVVSNGDREHDGAAPPAAADDPAPVERPAPPQPHPATPAVHVDHQQVVVERPAPAAAPHHNEAPRATPTHELPVSGQIAARVTELRLDHDGRHEMSLDLHPAELGRVGVDVVVEAGRVHVTVHAEHPAATDLLRASLDDLRHALANEGLDVGDLAARDQRNRSEGDDDRPRGRHGATTSGRGPELTITFPTRTTAMADSGVDVLL